MDIKDLDPASVMVADDLTITVVETSPIRASVPLKKITEAVKRWADCMGVGISKKSSVICLYGRQRNIEPFTFSVGDLKLPIIVDPTRKVRILGVDYDCGLTFRYHFAKVVAHFNRFLAAFRAPRLRGLIHPRQIREVYVSTCLSRLFYALPWYFRLSKMNRELLDTLHVDAARTITGCGVTARKGDVTAEAGLRTIETYVASRGIRLHRRLTRCPLRVIFTASVPDNATTKYLPFRKLVPPSDVRAEERAPAAVTWRPTPQDLAVHDRITIVPPQAFKVTRPKLAPGQMELTPEQQAILREANMKMVESLPPVTTLVATDASVKHASLDPGESKAAGANAFFVPEAQKGNDKRDPSSVSKFRFTQKRICSYTAELITLILTLQELLLRDSLEDESIGIVTDSGSVLSALATGPLRVQDPRIAELWQLLFDIAQKGARIILCFVFSHCGYNLNCVADANAESARKDGVEHQMKVSILDETSGFLHTLRRKADAECRANAGMRNLWRPGSPTMSPAWMKPGDAFLLHRLRVGVCKAVGGHIHGMPHSCPLCQQNNLGRGSEIKGAAVRHLFTCPSLTDIRGPMAKAQDLWLDVKAVWPFIKSALARLQAREDSDSE